MSTSPDLVEIYSGNYGAQRAAEEWRESQRAVKVRVVERKVSAFGASSVVHVVCIWYTEASKVHGWNG